MTLIDGELYVDSENKVWRCLGKVNDVYHITLMYHDIGYSTTCNNKGDIRGDNNKIVRRLPKLIIGKVYLDNNNQPWKYTGVGAIQRGVRHKAQYIGPIVHVHQTGLLYGYDHLKWGDIWLTDTIYFPISEGETFKDDKLFTWIAVQKFANGFSAQRVNKGGVLGDKNYPIMGVINWDGKLRICNNGINYEIEMIRLVGDWVCTPGEQIYMPKDNSELVNEVIGELEKRYELVPKKENIKFYHYPMIAKCVREYMGSVKGLIALLKEPNKGMSEAIILDPSISTHKVGDIILTYSNNWVPLQETFHMKNT